jgi:hypothetical protein
MSMTVGDGRLRAGLTVDWHVVQMWCGTAASRRRGIGRHSLGQAGNTQPSSGWDSGRARVAGSGSKMSMIPYDIITFKEAHDG